MMASSANVAKYLTHDYWIDVGQLEDYEIAKQDLASKNLNVPSKV